MSVMRENKFVPKLRFKGFNDEWKIMKLGEISKLFWVVSPIVPKNETYFGAPQTSPPPAKKNFAIISSYPRELGSLVRRLSFCTFFKIVFK